MPNSVTSIHPINGIDNERVACSYFSSHFIDYHVFIALSTAIKRLSMGLFFHLTMLSSVNQNSTSSELNSFYCFRFFLAAFVLFYDCLPQEQQSSYYANIFYLIWSRRQRMGIQYFIKYNFRSKPEYYGIGWLLFSCYFKYSQVNPYR